jgi:hypothetical protein
MAQVKQNVIPTDAKMADYLSHFLSGKNNKT